MATLGQMSPASIRLHVNDTDLAAQLAPFQLTSEETNWTRSDQITEMLTFVRKQTFSPPAQQAMASKSHTVAAEFWRIQAGNCTTSRQCASKVVSF